MSAGQKITSRQARILAAIVKEYAASPEPVGSEALEEKYDFGLSSATIRNEMNLLENSGFIAQPHTSAGRVPTDTGYRYFITQLMKHVELSAREQQRLQGELRKLARQHYELSRTITRILAESSDSAAFALLPGGQAASGFSNILSSDLDSKQLSSVANFLDNLEQQSPLLLSGASQQAQTFVGRESPVPLSENVSMIVSHVRLPDGKKGIVGIVGSKRMKYAKNISLLEYVAKLLGGGLTLILTFNFIR